MVPRNQSETIVPDHLLLVGPEAIDLANMQSHARKQGLPPSHGMRAHHGVMWRELIILVQGRAAGRHDIVLTSLARRLENGLRAFRGKGLEELLHGWRGTIVELVARDPESVAASGWGFLHAEEREVRWAVLEEA